MTHQYTEARNRCP